MHEYPYMFIYIHIHIHIQTQRIEYIIIYTKNIYVFNFAY